MTQTLTQEEAIQFLPMVMMTEVRLQVHTLEEVDGVGKHTNSCPRCCALHLLGVEQELEFN